MLVSSHLLGEMALLADELVVIGQGRLISQSSVDEFVRHNATAWVRVRSPQLPALIEALERRGATVQRVEGAEAIDVHDLAIEAIGETPRRRRSRSTNWQPRPSRWRTPSCLPQPIRRSTGREARRDAHGHVRVDQAPHDPVQPDPGDRRVPVPVRHRHPGGDLRRGRHGPNSLEMAELVMGLSVVTSMLLGVVTAIGLTSEYTHNTIRPTYAATPARPRVLMSKILVSTAIALVVAALTVFLTWFSGSTIFNSRGGNTAIGDPKVMTVLVSAIVLRRS